MIVIAFKISIQLGNASFLIAINVKYFLQNVKWNCLNVKYILHLIKINFMSYQFLLPNRFKILGWILFVPTTVLGFILSITGTDVSWLHTKIFAIFSDGAFGKNQSFGFMDTNITNTLIGVVFIIGAMLVGFSKEKNEDEFIGKLRLSSLIWAVEVNYILLLLAFIFIYGTPFLNVMVYNMFTVLILFVARFNYTLYKNSKTATDEK